MSNAGTCSGCERALSDGYLCRACTARLRAVLTELPELLVDLVVTAYRQDRIAFAAGGRASERPLPFKIRAVRLLVRVRRHLLVHPDERALGDGALCRLRAGELAGRALHDPLIGRLLAVLIEDVAQIRETIDLPRSFRYLGCCDACAADLYAAREAEVWPCPSPGCEASYDVAERIGELLERARQVVAPTSIIVTALTSLDVPVTEELIRKWNQRGLLTPRSVIGRHPGYLVGDVIDLVGRARLRLAERDTVCKQQVS